MTIDYTKGHRTVQIKDKNGNLIVWTSLETYRAQAEDNTITKQQFAEMVKDLVLELY